jgi:hypothetical protein
MFPATQSDGTIGLSVLGLAVALLGLAWLLAGSWLSARGRWWLLLALASLSGLGAGVAYAGEQPSWLWLPLLVLTGLELLALGCLLIPPSVGRYLVHLAGKVPVQSLVLVAGGLSLAGSQLWRLDEGLEREMSLAEAELSLLGEPTHLDTTPARLARTDAGQAIPLLASRAGADGTVDAGSEHDYLHGSKFDFHLIRTAPADGNYNCHGWVFTAGRYWVRGIFVERILKDNGYRVAPRVRPGDLAVFRNASGEVTHTALVHSVGSNGQVLVESKWGRLGRYLHTPDQHAYRGQAVSYLRTARGGHLLQGLGESLSSPTNAE